MAPVVEASDVNVMAVFETVKTEHDFGAAPAVSGAGNAAPSVCGKMMTAPAAVAFSATAWFAAMAAGLPVTPMERCCATAPRAVLMTPTRDAWIVPATVNRLPVAVCGVVLPKLTWTTPASG